MRKVKGLVLKSNKKHVYLLSPAGEYLRLQAGGRVYAVGAEVELIRPMPGGKTGMLALAAGILLLLLSSSIFHALLNQPKAYLALDINPSITLTLNSRAHVVQADAHNLEGREVLSDLKIKGLGALGAVEAILEESFKREYLSTQGDNLIFISLAAPRGFQVTETELQETVYQKVLHLEVDAFLRINMLAAEQGKEALGRSISMNAVLLGEKMREDSGQAPDRPGPPVSVKEFIGSFRPEFIFSDDEYIPGKDRAPGRPEGSGPPENIPAEKGKGNIPP